MLLTAFVLISCTQDVRYTQNSKEIDVVKSIIEAYNDKDWKTSQSYYADSSKTTFNRSKMASKAKANYHKRNDLNYTKRGFNKKGQEYEMVVDDKGKTWVNFWGTWQGTLKATGKEYTIPVHLTCRFKDGKIVEEHGYWDPSEIAFALKAEETKSKRPADEKIILSNIETFVNEFLNKQNPAGLGQVITDDYTRYFCDEKVATGQKELEANIAPFFKGFSNFHVKVLHKSPINENEIFVHWKVTGTHDGDFAGTAATGKKIKIMGLSRLHFDEVGKIDKEYLYFDQLSLMEQIGKTLN